MTTPLTAIDALERNTAALSENTRALEDLQRTVQALAEIQLAARLFEDRDHRPIEERTTPLPTIHREDT